MPKKKFPKKEMDQLIAVLRGNDQMAMWETLDRMKLSPKDMPFWNPLKVFFTETYLGLGSWGAKYSHHGEYSPKNEWAKAKIRSFVSRRKYARAIDALSFDSSSQFRQAIVLRCQLEWRRILAAPDRFLRKLSGEQKMLIEFFVQRPGLRRIVGGYIIQFYDPLTADHFYKKSSVCVVM